MSHSPNNPCPEYDLSISADALAAAFGCEDDSYGEVLSGYRALLCRPELRGSAACHNEADHKTHEVAHRLSYTMSLLGAVYDLDHPREHPAIFEFCHLHLPAFFRAFRLAATEGHRTATGTEGPDDHIWLLLWLIVKDPLVGRYIREHETGQTLLVDAMVYLSVILRVTTASLKQIRDWTHAFLNFTYTLDALILLIISSSPAESDDPYPHHTLAHPSARTLLVDLVSLQRVLSAPPAGLTETAVERVQSVKWKAASLMKCLDKRLTHDCEELECDDDAGKTRRTLSWFRCEGAGSAKGKCELEMELKACGRCQAVRYCSRAHQKAHWKIHKPTCKEPIW